ncbi:potassium channel family protein [Aneurinibacillus danicus]|jgi:trk system potassium uptake protein TrkA|uniref:Potassium transporter Trk n=1 Tax=Aneurinibacillus danicus TaxID=267746 RepID=A0A511VFR8_9BACL|nr:TrkA family potassium uptake protein [Aneurinibacillus danicus]GEN36808.1 potassium transporter Trk [Aneurinibacillus danicus]
MAEKSYAVIGLGRFGSSVVNHLHKAGYEVMAVDENEERVQEHVEAATHAVQADSTDEQALRDVGIGNFDVVVVAIGVDIQASILTTLLLKELGVKRIVAKAQNPRHGQVLYKVGADRVVFPERDMGIRVAHNLVSPNVLDFIELSPDYGVAEVAVSEKMQGKSLVELNVRAQFGVNVVAIKTNNDFNIAPGPEVLLQEGDILIVVGHNDDLRRFEEEM